MAIQVKGANGSVSALPEAVEEDELAPTVVIESKYAKKDKKAPGPVSLEKVLLTDILAAAVKEKGPGLVMKGSEVADMARIPTGVFEFDLAIGGGFPEGRVIIVYGPESSGKTNISLKAAANVQRRTGRPDKKVVFIDLEGTFSKDWAAKLGVNTEDLVVIRPGYGEECVDMVDAVVRADDVGLVILDSVAVLTAAREADKSVETADMATAATLVKRMCNKLAIALSMESRKKHYPCVVLLNQTRFKPGVMFGDPETMPGGQTMKFISALTIRLYGKNVADTKLHPTLPAWKDTSGVIKKSKVPVYSAAFHYDMAMQQCGDIDVGESDSWSTVANHLKDQGKLVKVPTGWMLFSEVWKTLAPIQEQYICDPDFRIRCQTAVINGLDGSKVLVEAKDADK